MANLEGGSHETVGHLNALAQLSLSVSKRLSLIQILPPDLLYTLFLRCHREDADFPIIASHVCQHWRTCALRASVLWRQLVFDTPWPNEAKFQAYIKRSGVALLDIKLYPEPFRKASMKTLRTILRLILPQAHRWKTLEVLMTPHKVTRAVFDRLVAVPVPELEALYITTLKEPNS